MLFTCCRWLSVHCVCVCVRVCSVSVLRAHQLRLRLSVGVLSVSDVSSDDRPRQHVSRSAPAATSSTGHYTVVGHWLCLSVCPSVYTAVVVSLGWSPKLELICFPEALELHCALLAASSNYICWRLSLCMSASRRQRRNDVSIARCSVPQRPVWFLQSPASNPARPALLSRWQLSAAGGRRRCRLMARRHECVHRVVLGRVASAFMNWLLSTMALRDRPTVTTGHY